ncbi:MAG: hypothetical protein JW894_04625 [Bacteroidales bacterium]|nr:hypothetical protein [Bacteroidales bacterium]
MKLRIVLFFFIAFSFRFLSAQKNFEPGYLIRVPGDTVYGDIDNRGDYIMHKTCRFKPNPNAAIKSYSPAEIYAYRFIDGKYYVSKEIDGEPKFIEVLIKGRVNIYFLKEESNSHYYLEKEGTELVEIPYEELVVRRDRYGNAGGSTPYQYKSTKHIGVLKYYMQDAPDFQTKIESIDKPNHKNLTNLAKDYHNKVCEEGEECVVYEKKETQIRVNPEIVAGVIFYSNVEDFYNEEDDNVAVAPVVGAILNLWIPGESEKLFLKAGCLFNEKSIQFPLQIEYKYPGKIIQPRIAIGVNIFMPLHQTVAFMGGLNIRMMEKLYWSVAYNIDFTPYDSFPISFKELYSQSVLTGMYIKF